MKTKVILISVACALAFSCTREESVKMVEWAFDTQYTKASIAEDGAFSWQQGDRIDIWDATTSSFVPFTTIAGKGRFTATAPSNASFSGAALYPSGIGVSPSSVSLPAAYASPAAAEVAFPMYAPVAEGATLLLFKHLCAMACFTVTSVQPELTKFEVRSAGYSLSGTFDLSTQGGTKVIQASSGSASVAVSFTLTQEGTLEVSLPVPVGTYPVSVCLGNGSDHEMLVVSSPASLTFERAHRYKFNDFDYLVERYALSADGSAEGLTVEDDTPNW